MVLYLAPKINNITQLKKNILVASAFPHRCVIDTFYRRRSLTPADTPDSPSHDPCHGYVPASPAFHYLLRDGHTLVTAGRTFPHIVAKCFIAIIVIRRHGGVGRKTKGALQKQTPGVDLSHMRKHYTYITKNKQLWILVVSLVAANQTFPFHCWEKIHEHISYVHEMSI